MNYKAIGQTYVSLVELTKDNLTEDQCAEILSAAANGYPLTWCLSWIELARARKEEIEAEKKESAILALLANNNLYQGGQND